MFVKSSSTGKPKIKQSQLMRMTECSTCPKLLPNKIYMKDHERPQPIKIAQLLGQSENLKSHQKNSVHKKIQPERLGTFSSIKSIKINEKQSERSTSGQHTSTNKRVRRILNFNEISISTTKDNKENKNHSNKSVPNKPFHKNISKPIKKRSLLLPPNTIKDKHLQKYNEKENKCSPISEISKSGSNIIESLNTNINPTVLSNNILIHNEQRINLSSDYTTLKFIEHGQHFKTLHVTPQSLISSGCKSSQQIIINNENHNNEDQIFTQNNSLHEKLIPNKNSLKSDIATKLKEADDVQNLCNDFQDSKLVMSENDMNIEHKSSKMIYINKDNIICLERNLRDLLKETERNRIKLKSTLTHVTRLLSINNEENPLSNIELKKENMIDKEVQVEICCKSTQYSEQLNTPITLTPQIIGQNVEILNKNMLNQDDENKKNNGNENTARISDVTTDGSFLELENQLNINYARATQNYSIRPKIPKIIKYKQKQSFREYMALKSNISFLETPDGKKFRSLCQIDNTDKSLLNVTYISNKLLTDLHNLYSESPES